MANGLTPAQPGDNSLWYGDPEAYGAAQASTMMQPAVERYVHNVLTGQFLKSGLDRLDVPYTPGQSLAQMAQDPQRLQAATDLAMGFSGGGLQFGAYHGTPAAPYSRFADEFMGSGEGAQSYSWGHYVAQAPGTAKSYVPPPRVNLTLNGEPWEYEAYPEDDNYGKAMAYDQLMDSNGNISHAVMNLNEVADMRQRQIDDPRAWTTSDYKQRTDEYRSAADFLVNNQENIGVTHEPGGNFANVNVVPDHGEFMDWDLPFSQQEPGVQEKLRSVFGSKAGQGGFGSNYLPGRDPLGKVMYDDLAGYHYDETLNNPDFTGSAMTRSRMLASKELDSAGIPGMRFADQGTRDLPSTILQYNGDELMHPAVNDVYRSFSDVGSMKHYLSALGKQPMGHQFQSGADWLDKNVGNFKQIPNPDKTFNYVVYDPNNLEITHWNGVPVTPVEGTPPGLSPPPAGGGE